jgi:hypothetical protein
MSGDRKGPWDLRSVNSLEAAAKWIRTNGGAHLVLVIRPHDAVVAIEPGMQPMQAISMIRNELPALLNFLIKRNGARGGSNPDAEEPE